MGMHASWRVRVPVGSPAAALLTLVVSLCLCAACHGSPAPRGGGRPLLRPLLLVDTETEPLPLAAQSLGLGPGQGQGLEGLGAGASDYTMMELNQLLNLFNLQPKEKRSLPGTVVADKVLQPGGAGMWFGPRLGRRRRSPEPDDHDDGGESARVRHVHAEHSDHRHKRSLRDEEDDAVSDNAWRLAEFLRDLPHYTYNMNAVTSSSASPATAFAPKRSHCDSSDINCLFANLAANRASAGYGYGYDQQQAPRSEGNLVNFTPRLGRESGEGDDSATPPFHFGRQPQRQSDENGKQLWFSPRLGRRLLPAGVLDVHAPADADAPPPSTSGSLMRHSRSSRAAADPARAQPAAADDSKEQAKL